MRRRDFWQYQARAVTEILDHFYDLRDLPNTLMRTILLGSPTGSGKTGMMIAVATYLLKHRDVDAVLVLTPASDIRNGFEVPEEIHLLPSEEDNTQGWSVDATLAVRKTGKNPNWVSLIKTHLTDPPMSVFGGILVATHAAGVMFHKEATSEFLDRINWERVLIIIDEAHHVSVDYGSSEDEEGKDDDTVSFPETELGKMSLEAQKRGAFVLMATATPYRASSREVIYPEDARLVNVSYLDYSREAGAPEHLEMDLVSPLDEKGLKDMQVNTDNQLNGTGKFIGDSGILTLDDARRLASYMADEADIGGEPKSKAIVRVTRVTDTRNVENITQAIKDEWAARGWREPNIVDGTGSNSKPFLDALKKEKRAKSFAESEVDIFLVCGRGVEGTDWPFCSHYYNVGVIGTIGMMIQVQGRGARSKRKYEDYPDEFRNVSRLVMFPPTISEKLVTKVRQKWHAGALLSACFMHSHKVAKEFMDLIDLRIRTSVRRGHKGSSRELSNILSHLNHLMPSPQDYAEAEQLIGAQEMRFESKVGTKPSISETVQMVCNNPEASNKVKAAGIFLCLQSAKSEEGENTTIQDDMEIAIRSFVTSLKSRKKRERGDLDLEMIEAFKKVAIKYDDITSMRVEGQIEIESKIRAKDTASIAEDMQKYLLPSPAYLQVHRCVETWYKEHPLDRKIYGDLSSYLGRPEGTYSASRLKRDIKLGLSGQPESIGNLDDLLSCLGVA